MPVRRAQQILKENSNVQDVKRASQPKLLPRHTTARMQYDQRHLLWDGREKKSCVGNDKSWKDIRRPLEISHSRNCQGGSLMVWGVFLYNDATPICFITHKIKPMNYVKLLDSVLIDFPEGFCEEPWIF